MAARIPFEVDPMEEDRRIVGAGRSGPRRPEGTLPALRRGQAVFDGFLTVASRSAQTAVSTIPSPMPATDRRCSSSSSSGLSSWDSALWMEVTINPPLWVHFILWIPLAIVLCLVALRLMKGVLITMQYANKAAPGRSTGDEHGGRPRSRRKASGFPWIAAVLSLLLFAVLIALGTWQLQRLNWKEGLLATIHERTHCHPEPLAEIERKFAETHDVDYLPVTTQGQIFQRRRAPLPGHMAGRFRLRRLHAAATGRRALPVRQSRLRSLRPQGPGHPPAKPGQRRSYRHRAGAQPACRKAVLYRSRKIRRPKTSSTGRICP